jgi:TolA-binding protein
MTGSTENKNQAGSSFQISELFGSDILSKYGWKVAAGLLIAIFGITYLLTQGQRTENRAVEDNKALGQVYVFLKSNQLDSARFFLESYIAGEYGKSAISKANLLLGNVFYQKEDYAAAVEAYSKVSQSMNFPLIASGGLYGAAASHMQLKQYSEAAELLEELITQFGRETGNPEKISKGTEEMDLSPAVPNALWKLALCYQQLQQVEQVKQTCEKLVRIYGKTEEGRKASRLLVTL